MIRIGHMLRFIAVPCAAALLLAACHRNEPEVNGNKPMDAAASVFAHDEQAWREKRRSDLLKPEGWTSLIGLHWLDPGSHYIGSDGGNGIHLSMGPGNLGMIEIAGKQVRFVPDKATASTLDGQPLNQATTLRTDADPAGPSVIGFDGDKGHATVIERNDRYALRVKHAEAPSRVHFAGLDYWPADPAWKIQGKFIPHPDGRTIEVANVIGGMDAMANPGVVEFQRDGKTYRIEALDEGEGVLFLVFADRTNGHGSYGAGRFLDTPVPDAHGNVTLDFNQSRNPPCAFTAFATCPLPPPENRVDLAITAGEKAYHKPTDS
jgi:uncharacterized protein (DUF1684 family)